MQIQCNWATEKALWHLLTHLVHPRDLDFESCFGHRCGGEHFDLMLPQGCHTSNSLFIVQNYVIGSSALDKQLEHVR